MDVESIVGSVMTRTLRVTGTTLLESEPDVAGASLSPEEVAVAFERCADEVDLERVALAAVAATAAVVVATDEVVGTAAFRCAAVLAPPRTTGRPGEVTREEDVARDENAARDEDVVLAGLIVETRASRGVAAVG